LLKISFSKCFQYFFFGKCMQFCQIGEGVTVPASLKNSRIFFAKFLKIHSVGRIIRHIYANFLANLRHRFPNVYQRCRTALIRWFFFCAFQFIIVSLKDGMFNNANVLFRTRFVDGMSAVQRTVNNRRWGGAWTMEQLLLHWNEIVQFE
jgi:hypothetical protein